MAKLTIRVNVNDNNETVSKFRTTRFNRIAFHNDGPAELTVVIRGAVENDSPICDNSGPVPSFQIAAGAQEKKFSFCGDKTKWTEFKYDATIGNAATEDPIVIIERAKFFQLFENPAAQVGAGVLIGALLTVAIMKMRTGRARPGT